MLWLLLCAGLGGIRAAQAATPVPEVRVRTARITGDEVATRQFQRGVTQGQAGLLRCYRDDLVKHVGEVGLVALTVRVEPTGRVSQVDKADAGVNADLIACVRTQIRAWRIAPWQAPQRVYAQLELVFQLRLRPAAAALIKGGIPAPLVAGTIEARLPGLLATCWKDAARPKVSPRLQLVAEYDGTVQTGNVTGRVPGRGVRPCLQRQLKGWDFPPPDNGHRTWIYYPLFVNRPSPPAPARRTGR